MDIKVVGRLVRENFAIVLFLVLSYSGALVFLWGQFQDLDARKIQFLEEKGEAAAAQNKRELELQQREYLLHKKEEENINVANELKANADKQNKLLIQLRSDQFAVGEAHVRKLAEVKLQSMMDEFSELGVNLNSNPYCGSSKEVESYNSAKIKFDALYSFAKANFLYEKYKSFFFITSDMS